MNVLVLRYTLDNQELANLSLPHQPGAEQQGALTDAFPPKKMQAGDLPACIFLFSRLALYCPASAICSRVMGSS